MKKLFNFVFLIITLICLTSCSNFKTSKIVDNPNLKLKAENIVKDLQNGNFNDVSKKFTKEMVQKLSVEKLNKSWQEVVNPIGKYTKHYKTTIEQNGKYYIAKVLSKYEKNGLVISITFNKEEKVAGLWLKHIYIPEDNEYYNEIEYKIGKHELSGILTIPKNIEKPPVVVLIAGSGPQDMNETIGTSLNTPLKDIAEGLAKNGIATLRYNKRYYEKPELYNKEKATIENEVLDDVQSAITQLSDEKRINNNNIFILGHSLGGMLTPKICVDNKNIKGAIILSGSLRNLAEISIDQNSEIKERLYKSKASDEEKDNFYLKYKKIVEDVNSILALVEDDGNTYLGLPSSYWISLNNACGINYISKTNVPMLILQGEKDFQISVQRDFNLWKKECKNKQNIMYKLYENLNHIFMKSSGLRTLEDYDTPNKVDKEVINDIVTWIKKEV